MSYRGVGLAFENGDNEGPCYSRYYWYGKGECPSCHCKPNRYHRRGCKEEDCPKCDGKLTSCGCHLDVDIDGEYADYIEFEDEKRCNNINDDWDWEDD